MIPIFCIPMLSHAAEILSADSGSISNPVWSESGAWIAFEQLDYGGNPQLHFIQIQDGAVSGSATKVSIGQPLGSTSTTSNPVSVDGEQFLFELHDQSRSRLLIATPGGLAAEEFIATQKLQGELSQPSISDDKTQIAFVASSDGNSDIYTWDRATADITPAVTSPYTMQDPVFSSAGVLTFTRQNNEDKDIYFQDGSNSTALASGDGDQIRPIWSGDQLVYFSRADDGERWDILVTAGGSSSQTLASDVRLPVRGSPALTADGQWLAYGSNDAALSEAIELVRLDGSQRTTIQTGHASPGDPAIITTGGRSWMAYTARTKHDGEQRSLHIAELTEQLSQAAPNKESGNP
jgi:Tol biopolymer transport system component